MKSSSIGKKKIALVHVARAKTGMTEVEYRDLLASVGVASSRDLDQKRFVEVMNRFRDMGFRSTNANPTVLSSKERQIKKIDAVLADQGLSRAYANSMANRMFRIQKIEWLDGRQLRGLIAALTYHQKRRKAAE